MRTRFYQKVRPKLSIVFLRHNTRCLAHRTVMDPPNKPSIASFRRPAYCCEKNLRLLPEQCKQQCEDDADNNGSDDGKVECKILFPDNDISGKSAYPRYLFSQKQEKTDENNKNPQKNKQFSKRTKANHLKYLLIITPSPSPDPSAVCPTFLYF